MAFKSTTEMKALAGKYYLDIIVEVFKYLELLEIGANRTHRAWDPGAVIITADDVERFLNNLAGLIAAKQILEDRLMSWYIYSTKDAQPWVKLILTQMVCQNFPTEEEIRADADALPEFLQDHRQVRVAVEMANATWAIRVATRRVDDTPYARIWAINSILQLISPELRDGETDEERIKRQLEVVKDYDQIRVAAQWWLDILNDDQKLVEELREIQAMRAELEK